MLISWNPYGSEKGCWSEVNGSGIYIPKTRSGNFRAKFQGVEILVVTQSQLTVRPLPSRTGWMRVPRYFYADTLEVMALPDQFEPVIEVDD